MEIDFGHRRIRRGNLMWFGIVGRNRISNDCWRAYAYLLRKIILIFDRRWMVSIRRAVLSSVFGCRVCLIAASLPMWMYAIQPTHITAASQMNVGWQSFQLWLMGNTWTWITVIVYDNVYYIIVVVARCVMCINIMGYDYEYWIRICHFCISI